MRSFVPGFLTAIFMALFVGVAHADILIMKDGRIFDGISLESQEGGYLVKFSHGDVFIPEALVETAVFESGSESKYKPKDASEKAKLENGLVPFQGKWMSAGKRGKMLKKFVKEQRASIADHAEHSVWRNRYKVKTKYFNFEHTISPHVFARYSRTMEAYFAAFCREWKVKPQKGYAKDPKDTRLLVCFYSDRELFHQVSGANSNVLGYFRFVKPLELDIYYDRIAPDDSTEVMFHEANHYLQKLINVKFSYPHFPGESLAEFYGASHWDDETGKLESGLILEGRLTEVQTDIAKGDLMSLEKMISTEMYEHYTWGWTLVHFLMNDKRYAKNFKKFFVGLAKDKKVSRQQLGIDGLTTVRQKDVLPLFMRYLGLKNTDALAQMEKEWHLYIQEELKVTSSFGLEKAADNATRHDRNIRARRLYQEAINTGKASANAHHRFAMFLMEERKSGDNEKILELCKKAVELDPLTGQFQTCLGHVMKAQGELEEGTRVMKLADEMGPKEANAQLASRLRRYMPIKE